jgi:hypothetical protein
MTLLFGIAGSYRCEYRQCLVVALPSHGRRMAVALPG